MAPRTFLSANPEFRDLALANASEFSHRSFIGSDHVHADPDNWTWHNRQRNQWTKFNEDEPWPKFMDRWCKQEEGLDQEDPSKLFLIDLALPVSLDKGLMVRKCYVEAEKLVWKTALSFPDTGAIITGQPGIGMIISCIAVRLF